MNTLDPIHVAVFIHTLVQRTVAENTLDGGHLKPLAGTGLVSRLFQQLRDTQHGNAILVLLEDELHDRSFLLVNGENTINYLVTVGTATTAVPAAGSLDGTPLAGSQSDVLSLLLCHELKQRTIDVGKLATLCEALLRTQKFDVLLFQHIQVVEVQLGITSHTVILEYDHRFIGRVAYIVPIKDFVQAGTVIFRTTDFINLPVYDVIAVVVGVEKNGLLLNLDTVFVIIGLSLGGDSDIADCVFECHHKITSCI